MATRRGQRGRILVDIDSTLYPSDPIFVRGMRELYGVEVDEREVTHWGYWLEHVSLDEFLYLIRVYFHAEHEILGAKPYPGAVEALNAWQAAGYQIHVVSDRHPRTAPATKAWLEQIGLRPDKIVLRSGIDKTTYAERHKIDLVIDDKPDTIRGARERGIAVATIRYRYNTPLIEADPEIVHARSWPTLRRRIERRFMPELLAAQAA